MPYGPAPVARWGAVIVFAVFAASAAASEAQPKNPVANFTLDNGLEVVAIPDHRAPIVTHMLWYKAGSADEEPGKSGIAHFFEHLMFKGTSTYPAGEFSEAVAAVGGSENAFTSYDYTAYFQQVAPDQLPDMMRYEADRMRNLVLSDEDIETERRVVLEERSQRTDNVPGAILSEELSATMYQHHPYGIPVIGWKREIEALTRDDLKAFYDQYYTPNNAVLVVAGDIDVEALRKLAEETYGTIARGPDLPPRVRPMEPEHKTARAVTLRDPRISVPAVSLNWYTPARRHAAANEFEAINILANILGQGLQSRLYQQLVIHKGIASSAGAYMQGGAYDYCNFVVYGEPRGEATLSELEAAIGTEIARIRDKGITQKELDNARTRILRDRIFASDSQARMAKLYGSTLATGGTVEDVQSLPERLEAVTVDDVQAAARLYLDHDRVVKGYLLPEEEKRT